MKHRLEILNIRDSYMMGDWVLNNGKPYRWEYGDYNRSQMGMKDIEPIKTTEQILNDNCFIQTGSYEWKYGLIVTVFLYKSEFDRVKILYTPKYDGFTYRGINVNTVDRLQKALRLVGLTELAENIKIE